MKPLRMFYSSTTVSLVAFALGATPAARAAPPPTVSQLADHLRELFPAGRHRYLETVAAEPLTMVQELVREIHDAASADDYRWLTSADVLAADDGVAGTFAPGAGEATALAALADLDTALGSTAAEAATRRAAAADVLRELTTTGARYGFDSTWENACAAPSRLLLVLDVERRTVDAIDLEPCQE